MKITGYTPLPPTEESRIDREELSTEDPPDAASMQRASLSFLVSEEKASIANPSCLDAFNLGPAWDYIKDHNTSADHFAKQILERRQEIAEQKKEWTPYTQQTKNPFFFCSIEQALNTGYLEPSKEGCGGAYVLYNEEHKPLFIIKPVDEEILCLNNRKSFASPFIDPSFRARDDIPLYRSAQTDLVCYEVAKLIGIEGITPKADIHILTSSVFYDISSACQADTHPLKDKVGIADNEKLCSVQEYIPDTFPMSHQIYQWLSQGYPPARMLDLLDPGDFEDANLLVWMTYDTDAHPGNFLLSKKPCAPGENSLFHIKKIDNSLSFPEKHSQFMNFLMFLDVEKKPLSAALRDKIRIVPIEQITSCMGKTGMSMASIISFVERAHVIKGLAIRPLISIYEMNLRLSLLSSLSNGMEISLSDRSLEELEVFLQRPYVPELTDPSS